MLLWTKIIARLDFISNNKIMNQSLKANPTKEKI